MDYLAVYYQTCDTGWGFGNCFISTTTPVSGEESIKQIESIVTEKCHAKGISVNGLVLVNLVKLG